MRNQTIGLENMSGWIVPERPLQVYLGCSMTCEGNRRARDELLRACEETLAASGIQSYNPVRHTKPGSPHSVQEVYAIDHLNAMKCDLVFFLRTNPSLGMGMEAQVAADLMIPWFDARSTNHPFHLTPLVAGLPNERACGHGRIHFSDTAEFRRKLQEVIRSSEFGEMAIQARLARNAASEVVRGARIGRTLLRQRLLLNMSSEHLGALADVQSWWIESVERDEWLTPGLTIIQLMRLLESARLKLVPQHTVADDIVFPRLETIDDVPARLLNAAEEFVDYHLRSRNPGEPLPETDDQMLEHWRNWSRELPRFSIPKTKPDAVQTIGDLTACLSAPLSHLSHDQRKASLELHERIQDAIKKVSGVVVQTPGFIPDRNDSCPQIYLASLDRMNNADFGIVVASPPATGVGISTQLFANASMPCIYLVQQGSPISRMFDGIFCRRIGNVIEITPTEDVGEIVAKLVVEQLSDLRRDVVQRRSIRDRIAASGFEVSLDRFAIPRRLNRSEAVDVFATTPFVRAEWLKALVDNPMRQCTMTLLQFVHIAIHQRWSIDVSDSGVPCFHVPSYIAGRESQHSVEKRMAADMSLKNLIAARDQLNKGELFQLEDTHIFDAWENYQQEVAESLAYREGTWVRSQSDWVSLLNNRKRP